MSVLNKELTEWINDPTSLKSLATVSREGVPHVAYKGSLHVEDDKIVFYDLIQSYQTNKNLVHAIWFNGTVAVNILTADKRSFLILGKPVKSVTAGRGFEKVYVKLQEERGTDVDLSAIWYIEPLQIREETYAARRDEEERKYPYIRHLDRV